MFQWYCFITAFTGIKKIAVGVINFSNNRNRFRFGKASPFFKEVVPPFGKINAQPFSECHFFNESTCFYRWFECPDVIAVSRRFV